MTAPRDGVMRADRSTQLHDSWDNSPIAVFRPELLGAIPSNQKNDDERNVVSNERREGNWRSEKERDKRAYAKAKNHVS
jgi:hypothetical protein